MDFVKILPYMWMFWEGFLITIKLTIYSAVFGFLIAMVLVVMSITKNRFLNTFAAAYIVIIRSIPMLLQLFIVYFAAPQILGEAFNMKSATAATVALSFNGAAYYAEVLRGGIKSIDLGQREAAQALGVGKIRTVVYIIFPQATKKVLPSMLNEFILLFKETSLVSQIGVVDLFHASSTICKNTYTVFEPYVAVAFIYYAVVMVMSYFTSIIERRLRLSD